MLLINLSGFLSFANSWESFEEFNSKLSALGISPASLNHQQGLTRYQLTRLLNAVECQDCILPTQTQITHFDQNFWSNFSNLPGKDFRDISYLKAQHNTTNYYYCVAHVGEQNYMRGYPQSTSPLCSGNFCGTRLVSKWEFYQTLVNLLSSRLASTYTIPRKEIKTWLNTLQKSSYQYRTFDTQEIQLITNSKEDSAPAQSAQELHLYLKYCTFNPAQCGFRTFETISSGVRPLAQMNLLIKEGIITDQDTSHLSSPISTSQAVQMLYQVYSLHTQCSFNTDYDCDNIKNHQDNCPYTYNPSQTNLDGDQQGDVCDTDIDGDGQSNPLGFVDETWNINYALLYSEPLEDKTPLGANKQDQYHFLIIDSISKTIPATVKMHIQSKTAPHKIERDFGDGATAIQKNSTISHTYTQWWHYTIRAKIEEKSGQTSLISSQILIPEAQNPIFLWLSDLKITDNQAEISANAIGNFDRYEWYNSATKETKSTNQLSNFSTKLLSGTRNNITLKAYLHGNLVAFASTDIRSINGKFINTLLQIPSKNYTINEKISPILRLTSLSLNQIAETNRKFWQEKEENKTKNLTSSHRFLSAGQHQIIQETKLKNWESLYTTATLKIADQTQTTPLAVNLYYLSLKDKNLGVRLQSLFPQKITEAAITFSPQEAIKKENITSGESLYYRLGKHWNLNIQANYTINNTLLSSQATITLSATTLGEKEQVFSEEKMYQGLKCDLDKAKVPDIYDIDVDWDGIPNLLGMINYEKDDCSLIPWENVNQNLYQQHFGICSLDNCPFVYNKDQADLNNNGIWDVCEAQAPKCWDQKIDQWETCLSCPQDVWECTSICGNGIAEEGETQQNCPEDVPPSSCGNGKIDKNLNEECDNGSNNGKDNKCSISCSIIKNQFCWNGKIDQWETCLSCPKDVQRCFSLCGNGIVETHLWEECDNWKLNGKDKKCSLSCQNENLCWNGKIDQGETCLSCPQDIRTCDADWDKIPDPIDECPNIPEDHNGKLDRDWCPEPPQQCQGENCPLVLPVCNSCPCQYADFSNTLHKNDQIRAQLRDLPTQNHYNYSNFVHMLNMITQ